MKLFLSLLSVTLLFVAGCADDADAQIHSPVGLGQPSAFISDSQGVKIESTPAAALYYYRSERVGYRMGAPVRAVRGVLRVRPVRRLLAARPRLLGRACGRLGCR